MKPVRIKYYGMFWMTKQTYFILLALFGGVAFCALLIGTLAGKLPPLGWPWVQKPVMEGSGFVPLFANAFWFIILMCLVAQTIDTLLVLRKFAQKEAEQRAMFDALDATDRSAAAPSARGGAVQPVPGVQPDRHSPAEPQS
jgi:hypothetical protein